MMSSTIDGLAANQITSTVMIVDDQSTNLEILGTTIRNIDPDISIMAFQDPTAALSAVEINPPDLVITDYKMPTMNGIEFTQQFRQKPNCHDVPIIMITIMNDKSILYNALENGVTDFLSKPFDQLECQARCKNLLSLGRHQTRLRKKSHLLEIKVNESSDAILLRERETLNRLTKACEYKDCITGEHLIRMSRISYILALELGLNSTDARELEIASPLHDIGKIAIPDKILLKKDKLTPDEFEIMKTHTEIGYEILKDSPSPYLQKGAIVALNHHEKFDGSGYPNRIAGNDIPIEARIVTVADVFDSLTNHRPYKKAWSVNEAIEYVKAEKRKHLDPDCVDALVSKLDDINNSPTDSYSPTDL